MTNYEKYKDEIEEMILSGKAVSIAVTKDNKIAHCRDIICENCALYHPGVYCGDARKNWLNSEYVEPSVDWSKVAVDTKVLVSSNCKEWFKRYFAKYENGQIFVWGDGATSWSVYDAEDFMVSWKHTKLAEEE